MQSSGRSNGRTQLDTAETLGLLFRRRLDVEVELQGGCLEVGTDVHAGYVLTLRNLVTDFLEVPLQI